MKASVIAEPSRYPNYNVDSLHGTCAQRTARIAGDLHTGTYRKIDDPAADAWDIGAVNHIAQRAASTLTTKTFAAYGGVSLVGDVGGDLEGEPIILLHGGGQTRHSWGQAALELAARGYYVAAIDLRGHGD